MAKTALTVVRPRAFSEDNAASPRVTARAAPIGSANRPGVFPSGDRVMVRIAVSNDTAAPTNCYVVARSRRQSDQGFYNHVVGLVAKNHTRILGPFPPQRFGDEVELYFTSDAPDTRIDGGPDQPTNGFRESGTLATLGTELSTTQAAQVSLEVFAL